MGFVIHYILHCFQNAIIKNLSFFIFALLQYHDQGISFSFDCHSTVIKSIMISHYHSCFMDIRRYECEGRSSNSGSVTIVTATEMRLLLLVSLFAILLQLHGGAADRGINPNTGKWCKGCKIRICSGAPTRGRYEGCDNYCNVSCSRGGPRWIKQAYVGRWWRDEMMILLEKGKKCVTSLEFMIQ